MKLGDPNNTYIKPEITQQDRINSNVDEIKSRLNDSIQIHPDNFKDIDLGIWIKYITSEGKYRSGGVLISNKAPEYFILKNPRNEITWSVKLDNCSIFMKDIGAKRDEMIEKNNLYRLYQAGYVKITDEPDQELLNKNENEN
jgi:hypothetical protein